MYEVREDRFQARILAQRWIRHNRRRLPYGSVLLSPRSAPSEEQEVIAEISCKVPTTGFALTSTSILQLPPPPFLLAVSQILNYFGSSINIRPEYPKEFALSTMDPSHEHPNEQTSAPPQNAKATAPPTNPGTENPSSGKSWYYERVVEQYNLIRQSIKALQDAGHPRVASTKVPSRGPTPETNDEEEKEIDDEADEHVWEARSSRAITNIDVTQVGQEMHNRPRPQNQDDADKMHEYQEYRRARRVLVELRMHEKGTRPPEDMSLAEGWANETDDMVPGIPEFIFRTYNSESKELRRPCEANMVSGLEDRIPESIADKEYYRILRDHRAQQQQDGEAMVQALERARKEQVTVASNDDEDQPPPKKRMKKSQTQGRRATTSQKTSSEDEENTMVRDVEPEEGVQNPSGEWHHASKGRQDALLKAAKSIYKEIKACKHIKLNSKSPFSDLGLTQVPQRSTLGSLDCMRSHGELPSDSAIRNVPLWRIGMPHNLYQYLDNKVSGERSLNFHYDRTTHKANGDFRQRALPKKVQPRSTQWTGMSTGKFTHQEQDDPTKPLDAHQLNPQYCAKLLKGMNSLSTEVRKIDLEKEGKTSRLGKVMSAQQANVSALTESYLKTFEHKDALRRASIHLRQEQENRIASLQHGMRAQQRYTRQLEELCAANGIDHGHLNKPKYKSPPPLPKVKGSKVSMALVEELRKDSEGRIKGEQEDGDEQEDSENDGRFDGPAIGTCPPS